MIHQIKSSIIFFIFLLTILCTIAKADRDVFDGETIDIEFRVAVDAGKKDCFYQTAKKDHLLEISFRVINSKLSWMYPLNDNTDLRIGFEMFDPFNRLIMRKDHAMSETHIHQTLTDGVYVMCFDNSHSRMSSKIINIELYLYSDQDDDRWGNVDPNIKFEEENKIYSDSVEVLKTQINKIRDNLQNVRHSQDSRQAIETRDHNLMSSLSRFINFFSIISLIMIPLVGFSQIMLIRSLFEPRSSLAILFKPIPFFNFLNFD